MRVVGLVDRITERGNESHRRRGLLDGDQHRGLPIDARLGESRPGDLARTPIQPAQSFDQQFTEFTVLAGEPFDVPDSADGGRRRHASVSRDEDVDRGAQRAPIARG